MTPAQHASNTSTLLPPEGAKAEECTALPITRCEQRDATGAGIPLVRSYWRPSADELAALNRGAKVCFQVWGTNHPPVYIGVERVREDGSRDPSNALALVGEEG